MSASFRQLIDEVRERCDLVALIRDDIHLEACGSVLKGRSPFNPDKHPSFIVWPDTQTWRDFSGGGSAGGDCFDYIIRRDDCGFGEALQILAAKIGVALPGESDPVVVEELRQISERRRIEDLLTAAAAYYHGVLPSKIRRVWFNEKYGFSDEIIDDLLLGWADGHLFEHLTGLLGASKEDALATGLFVRLKDSRVEDFFRDRLVFPYWKHGRVVYFIARATEHTGDEPWEQAKYKKLLTRSDRHPYVSRFVTNDTFYNEDIARGAGELLITEGVTDCISAAQAKVPCISPVTVRFRKKDHGRLLALTEKTKRIIICNDAEESGAGEEGAVETAQVLHAAGRDVRIGRIPRSDEKVKVDVNDLVRDGGPEALGRVIASAKRLPEYLIERIPKETPKAELADVLAPVLEMVQASHPIEQEAYADLIKARFKLKAATVKALLGRRGAEQNPTASDLRPTASHKGEVFEDTDHYYLIGRNGERVVISSFQIEPRRRIALDDGEIIDADVTTDKGRVFHNMRFPREAWQSKRAFLRFLGPVDLQWTGSDENLQGVLRLVASRSIPSKEGTRNLGYFESSAGPRWVTPDGVLAPEGQITKDEALIYVSSGASLERYTRYRPADDPMVKASAAAVVLPSLLKMNAPEVVLPLIGWFFAAPLKPRVRDALGHFPIMWVWGSPGSGKTTILKEIFWPLIGVSNDDPYSVTSTEFSLLKLLSSTNAVPVVLDEYKPSDMPQFRLNTLHRYLRRVYAGETEERGRADLTVTSFHLLAPVCVAGETRPTEPALVERMLTANPSKTQLDETPSYQAALSKALTVDPRLLAPGIVRFLLGRDTGADIRVAREAVERILVGRELPYRVRDNLLVMALGLVHFEEYAVSLGIELPELEIERAVEAVLDDVLEGSGDRVKGGLDYFLEELSVMAISEEIEHARHYVYREGLLAIHFPSCHAAFTEHCRRTGYRGEVPDRKALRRQLLENQSRRGYVRELDVLVTFRSTNDRRRAVLIDLDEAKQTLVIDDFPQPEARAGWHGWEPE